MPIHRPLALASSLLASSLSATALAQTPAAAATPRVVGGHDTAPGAYPWQVALLSRKQPDNLLAEICGGTLIRPDWVLTAAHCLDGADPVNRYDVLVGGYDLSNPASGTRIRVVQSIMHPGYDWETADNDVALLRIATPVNGSYMRVTEPSPGPENMVGTLTTIIGWGDTAAEPPEGDSTSNYPKVLQETQVPIVDTATCNAPASYDGQVTAQMFCAGYPAGGKDTCFGDSGGPAVVADAHSRYVQVGITSWGNGCAWPNFYGIYTRVASFSSWISSVVGKVPTVITLSAASGVDGARKAGTPVQVSVQAAAAGYGAPTGTVLVSDEGGHSCTVTVPTASSCDLPGITGTLSARYSGDTTFGASGWPAAAVPVLAPWAAWGLLTGIAAAGGVALRRRSRKGA